MFEMEVAGLPVLTWFSLLSCIMSGSLAVSANRCPTNSNTSLYPAFLRVTTTDLAGSALNLSGVYQREVGRVYPSYRLAVLQLAGGGLRWPGQQGGRGELLQAGLTLSLDSPGSGRWQLREDGAGQGFLSTDQACTHLLATRAHWELVLPSGTTSRIRLTAEPLGLPDFPDFYRITGAPVTIDGWYARTYSFQSHAPIYRKPGEGSSENFLFLYKGSWMVARDPMSSSMTYRMVQLSRGSLAPLPTTAWHVVLPDGSVEASGAVRATPVQQTFPPTYTLSSSGPAASLLPAALGLYTLSNLTRNSRPVFRHSNQTGLELYSNVGGSWVVGGGRELLAQDSRGAPLPLPATQWRYYIPGGGGWSTDPSLQAVPGITAQTRAARIRLPHTTLYKH